MKSMSVVVTAADQSEAALRVLQQRAAEKGVGYFKLIDVLTKILQE